MSPEQLNGATPKPAQDVYSFAAMAYECLKGEPPFCRGAIEDQIKHKIPDPLPGNDSLSKGVMRGLAKRPEERPKTCLAVLDYAEPRNNAETQSGRAARPLAAAEAQRRTQSGGAVRGRDSDKALPADEAQSEGSLTAGGRIAWAVAFAALVAAGGYCVWQRYEASERAQAEAQERRVAEAERKAREQAAAREAEEKARGMQAEQEADNGHEKVQLWEGGPYWATTNVGANQPWEYGLYFWWGDTTGQRPLGETFSVPFEASNCPTYNKSITTLQSEGWIASQDGLFVNFKPNFILTPEHDAAHVQWGGAWRIPTEQELDGLNRECDWKWTTWNGAHGYTVQGRGLYAGKSIFLPVAGYGYGSSLVLAGSSGYYWSSVPDSVYYCYDSKGLCFYLSHHGTYHYYSYLGFPVRPVQGVAK